MRNHIIISFTALLLLCAGCSENFDDHYDTGGGASHDETVFQRLSGDPNYSIFTQLVRDAGLEDYLSGSDLVTIWAPSDDTVPDEVSTMSDDDKAFLVKNHISISTLYSRNLTGSSLVGTLAGKSLRIAKSKDDFTVDGVEVKSADNLYKNGLVHEIEGWLLPKKNISQWIESLTDEYSIFRDSLYSHNVRYFDKENSPIRGVNEEGTIVYDSVWVVSNDYLNNISLDDEGSRYTLLVPSNDVLRESLRLRKNYFDSVGRTMTAADTSAVLTWAMKASIYRGALTIAPDDVITSASGREMRVSYQEFNEPIEMSNGYIYTYKKLYAPKNIHFTRLDFNPYYIRKEILADGGVITFNKGSYDKYYSGVNNTASKIIDSYPAVFWQFNSTARGNYYQFEARAWNEETEKTEDMYVMPGHYTLRMQFINYGDNFNTDVLEIYEVLTDGKTEKLLPINTIRGVSKRYYYTEGSNGVNGVVSDDYEITGNYGRKVFRAVIPGSYTNGTQRRICVGTCSLIPNDNY